MLPVRYLASLKAPTLVLWCYLIWYLVTVAHHFDPSPRLWLNSVGISLLIGTALVLSVGVQSMRTASRWVPFRLFLMPFCVSSFASLIKGQGFVLVLPPARAELVISVGMCGAFLLAVALVQFIDSRRSRA